MKKVKIRELKSNVKIIRELERTEGDKEIAQITKGEPMTEEFASAGFSPREASVTRPVQGNAAPRIAQESPREQGPTGHLYNSGRSMSEEGRVSYKAPESVGESGLRQVGVGRDFAMNQVQGGGTLAEANRIETQLRQSDDNKKYESDNVKSASGKKSRRYAWEA